VEKLHREDMAPTGPFSLSFSPAGHFGNGDFHNTAIFNSLHGDVRCIGPETSIEGVQSFATFIKVFNHPRPAVADHTVAIHMAWVSPCMLANLRQLTSNREADFRIRLHEKQFFALKPAMKIDLPVRIMIIQGNDIRLLFQGQPQITDLFFAQQLFHFITGFNKALFFHFSSPVPFRKASIA